MKKILLTFIYFICALTVSSQIVVPGGNVSDTSSFIRALGGYATAQYIYNNTYQISLNQNVAFDTPIHISAGNYFLYTDNDTCTISPNDSLTELFYIENGASLRICSNNIENNSSLFLLGKTSDTTLCTQSLLVNYGLFIICDNVCLTNFEGSGSCIDNHQNMSVNGTLFQNNTSFADGGAIHAYPGSFLNFTDGKITENHAVNGGALTIDSGATVFFTKGIIENNTASSIGNAIFVDSAASLYFSDSITIRNNNIYLSDGAVISAQFNTFFKSRISISLQNPQLCQDICRLVNIEATNIPHLRDSILLDFTQYELFQTSDNQYLRLFNPPTILQHEACSYYYWETADSLFTQSTDYPCFLTATSTSPCDSIVILSLQILYSSDTLYESFCENEFPLYLQNDTIEVAGTYTYSYTSSHSCDSVITLVITSIPTLIDTMPTLEFCEDQLPVDTLGITLTEGGNYQIFTVCSGYHLLPVIVHELSSDTIDISVCSYEIPYQYADSTLTESGQYLFRLQSEFGCDSTILLNFNVFPETEVEIAGPDGICLGDTSTLSVATFTNYLWNNDSTSQSIQVFEPNTYTVTITDENGCQFFAAKKFEVDTYPVAEITGNTPICSGDSSLFIASGGETYLWHNNSEEDSIYLSDSQLIILNAYSHHGCLSSDTLNFTVNFTPEISLLENDTICFGDSVTYLLTFDTAYQYLWSTGDTLHTITVSPIESTHYEVTVSNRFSGCNVSKSLDLTVAALPGATISGDTSLCEHSALELTATGNGSYLWNTGDTTDILAITTAGLYSVTVSTPEGCTSTASHNILEISAIIPIISGNTVICDGETTVLSAEGAFSYLWNTGEETADIVVQDSGRYSVTVTYLNGCTASAEKLITLNPNPSVNITGNTEICLGKSTTLTATEGYTYLWNTGEITASVTVFPEQDAIYFVTATNQYGCSSIAIDTINIKPLPTAIISGNNEFCEFTTTTLTSTGGTSYLWNTNETTDNITISSANTYTVTITAENGCTATQSKEVSILPAPIPTISGNNFICAGEQTLFSTSGGIHYQWNNGESQEEIQLTEGGTYTVTVTYANGCSKSAYKILNINPLPQITIQGDTIICIGETSLITAGGGRSYHWNTGETTALLISTPSHTTYNTLQVTSSAGCVASRLVTIVVNALPTPEILGESTFCLGDSLTLYASGGTQYEWNTGTNNNAFTVKSTGNYVVTVTNNAGCTASISHPVTANPRPTVNIIGNTSFCQGESITLMATGGNSYLWSNGSTQQSTTVSASNTYTVTATNSYNCTSTASVNVSPLALPVASISGNASFCSGQSTTLTAQGGISYRWNDGTTDASITVYQAGTYSVTVTNPFGCTSSISKTVQMNALPTPTITGNESFCEGNSTNLLASGGATYFWNNGTTNAYLNVSETGTYSVTVTDNNGCSAIANKTVLVNSIPQINISGDTNICIGNSTMLMANVTGGGQYNWDNGETGPFITVTPTNTRSYTVVVTNSTGCTNTGRFTVNVRQYPTASILGSTSFCQGDSTTLTATGGNSFSWNNEQSTASIITQTPGNYIVTVSNLYGCTSTANREVTVNALPLPSISGTTAICQGESATLTAAGGVAYMWSTNEATATIYPTEIGTYIVTVSNNAGCTATAQTNITVNSPPDISISGVNAICAGKHAILTAHSSQTSNFVWSTESIGASTSVSTAGTYTVTATNINGCTATANHEIIVNTAETPIISGNLSPCAGESTTLTANNGTSFQWSNGTIGNSITVTPSNTITYSVTATSAEGCTASNSVAITLDPLPTTVIEGDISLCAGESTTLTAVGGTNFIWSNQHTGNSITVATAGEYSVTATNLYGCSVTPSVIVSVNPYPIAQISGNDECCTGDNLTLTTSGGTSYLWSNGGTTAIINENPTQNTTYSCTVTNEYGCEVVIYKNITVNAYPTPEIYGEDFFCQNGTVQLTAAGGTSYLWSNGEATPQINVLSQGVYSVTVTDNNCAASTYTYISQYANPLPTITGELQFCNGSATTLTATGGTYYQWNSGENNNALLVTEAGTYQVTVTDENGCTASTSIQTVLLPSPDLAITGNFEICDGASTTLFAIGGTSYLWNDGETSSSLTISPTTTTPYAVTATNSNNCTATESVTVNVYPTFNQLISDEICQGSAYSDHDFSLPVQTEAGTFTYYRYLTTAKGCDSTITLTLTVNPKPVLSENIVGTANISTSGNYSYSLENSQYANSFEWSISNPFWILSSSSGSATSVNINTGGSAVLSVFGINNCGISATTTLQIVSTISIEEYEIMENIEIYPNPFTQFVNIKNNSEYSINSVQIFDITGKLILEKDVESNLERIDFSSFTNGIYILKLINENQVLGNVKIVKQQ